MASFIRNSRLISTTTVESVSTADFKALIASARDVICFPENSLEN